MGVPDPLTIELLLAAVAGGAFGAAIGALPSFALAGFVVVLGEVYALVGKTVGVESLPVDVTASIGFGAVFGPHVAFGGGAAAAAYAARQGLLDVDDPYPGKQITHGLGTRPAILAVGGLFGMLGHLVWTAATALSLPTDPVAVGVVVSALCHRVVFGYDVVGAGPRAWLSAGPTAEARTDGGSRRVDPWLSYQSRWPDVGGIGAIGGLLGAYVAYLTASPFLAFGLSAFALSFLCAGVDAVPVTHHVTLPASTVTLALVPAGVDTLTPATVAATVPLGTALAAGAALGLVGAVCGEGLQRIFYAHAETHFDPPAASIVCTSLLVAALAAVGVLETAVWIPMP